MPAKAQSTELKKAKANGRYDKIKCPHCPKSFIGNQGLASHIRTFHKPSEITQKVMDKEAPANADPEIQSIKSPMANENLELISTLKTTIERLKEKMLFHRSEAATIEKILNSVLKEELE